MSLFWDYFRSLNHPLTARGLFRALAEGGAGLLDAARDDALWLRSQFLPEQCEVELLDEFARSRGLRRLPFEVAERYRSRVVHAWRKGTVASVQDTLAAAGYWCSVREADQLLAAWTAAGGEVLDGAGVLDGGSTLSAPGAHFDWVPTHWAEYAIDLDIAAGEFSRAEQRAIVAAATLVAPARSRLIGLRFHQTMISNRAVLIKGHRSVVAAGYTGCQASTVPTFRVIGQGCEMLGGEDIPDLLDDGMLDGFGLLSGLRPDGEPLNHGWGQMIKAAIHLPTPTTMGGGDLLEPPEYIDGFGVIETLDGRGWISVEALDGLTMLDDSDTLEIETLVPYRPDTLDGTSRLGRTPGAQAIWTRATISHRRYRHIIKEVV